MSREHPAPRRHAAEVNSDAEIVRSSGNITAAQNENHVGWVCIDAGQFNTSNSVAVATLNYSDPGTGISGPNAWLPTEPNTTNARRVNSWSSPAKTMEMRQLWAFIIAVLLEAALWGVVCGAFALNARGRIAASSRP